MVQTIGKQNKMVAILFLDQWKTFGIPIICMYSSPHCSDTKNVNYPCPFVLDENFFIPMSGNCDESFFAQHDATADSVRELASAQKRLKKRNTVTI